MLTATLTVRAPGVPGSVTNVVTVASETPDPNGANDASDAVVTAVTEAPPPPVADLALFKSAPASVETGQPFRYQLTVVNTSAQPARGVTLVDALPAEVALVSAPADCTTSGATVTCTLGSLEGGEIATRFIEVAAPATATTLVNSATVTSDSDDPNPGNDRDSAETVVTAPDGNAPQPGLVVRPGQNTPANATVVAGSAGNPVLQVAVTAAEDEAVSLGGFTLSAAGSGQDALDLTAVKVFADLDGDGRAGPGDSLLATGRFAADDGTLELAPAAEVTVPAGATVHLLVTADLNAVLVRGPFVPLLSLAMLGFGLRSLARRRRLWLLLALIGVLLVTGCSSLAPTPPLPPQVETASYQLTLTRVTGEGAISGTAAEVTGLPLGGARLEVRR